MAVTAITQVTQEGYALSLASFASAGALHLMWSTQLGSFANLWWKAHDDPDFSEIQAALVDSFRNLSAIIDPVDGSLIVAYDDATEVTSGELVDSNLSVAVFDPITGALLDGPLRLGKGLRGSLLYRGGAAGDVFELVYASKTRGSIYIRESRDGGHTWSMERPVLNNYVRNTVDVVAVPFDDEHLSVIQLGLDARPLVEMGSISRTRPLQGIVKHPTLADRYLVAEPSWIASVLTDHLRGALRLSRDNATLYHLDGQYLGASDSIGELALVDTSTVPPTVSDSKHDTAHGVVSAGVDLNEFAVSPFAVGTSTALFGATPGVGTVDMDVSNAYAYVAGNSEGAGTVKGAFAVLAFLDHTQANVIAPGTGVICHAVGVGIPPANAPVIFLASNEGGQETLRIYVENALTPDYQTSHKLPARANKILVQMTSGSAGLVYISMDDRLNVYQVNGLTSPIRLILTIPVLSRGAFHQVSLLANKNIVAAMGSGGVGVFNTDGGCLSETVLTGVFADIWRPGQNYASNDLVKPTPDNQFASQRRYFKCITPGISGKSEPPWAPVSFGNVSDNTAVWQEVGPTDAVVTGVAVDQTRRRIHATAVVGGPLGVFGRFYTLDARGLV